MQTGTLTDVVRALEFEVATLLRAELAEANLSGCYIVASEAAGIELNANCGGCTGDDFCWLYESHMADRWSGPGPTILLNTSVEDDDSPNIEALAAVVAHEVAHIAREQMIIPPPQACEPAMALREVFHLANIAAAPNPSEPFQRNSHDAHFVRTALHVAARMTRDGWPIDLNLLLSGCDVSPLDAQGVLAEELEALGAVQLSRINLFPAPASFWELFPRNQ